MEKLLCRCMSGMVERGIVEKNKEAVILYGLDLLLSSVLSIMSLLFVGMICGKEVFTIVLLLTFIPLQSFGGGFHCQTHMRCWGIMLVGYLFAVFLMARLPLGVLLIGGGISSFSFLKLAPIENKKAPFGIDFKKKMRKIVVGVYIVLLEVSAIGFWMQLEVVKPILCAVILSGVSIFVAKLKNELRDQL